MTTVGALRADVRGRMTAGDAGLGILSAVFATLGPDDRVITDEEMAAWSERLLSDAIARETAEVEHAATRRRRARRRQHLVALVNRLGAEQRRQAQAGTCGCPPRGGSRLVLCRACATSDEWAYVQAALALRDSREAAR